MAAYDSLLRPVHTLIECLTRGQALTDDGVTLKDSLRDTPKRFLKAWYEELCVGYDFTEDDIASMLTQFDGESYDEIVLVKNVEYFSTCEHHLMQFVGVAHIAYIPDKKIAGLSKLSRLLEIYSRRLQVQERICMQVTAALMKHLQPLGAACILTGKHSCVCARGVNKQQSEMITSSMVGVFREDRDARNELLRLIGM